MASNAHAKTERQVPASNSVPLVESFAGNNGDLNINLNRSQWQTIMGSLAIASWLRDVRSLNGGLLGETLELRESSSVWSALP